MGILHVMCEPSFDQPPATCVCGLQHKQSNAGVLQPHQAMTRPVLLGPVQDWTLAQTHCTPTEEAATMDTLARSPLLAGQQPTA